MTRGPNREQHARADMEKENDFLLSRGQTHVKKQTDLQFFYTLCSLWYSVIAHMSQFFKLAKKRLYPSPSNWRLH